MLFCQTGEPSNNSTYEDVLIDRKCSSEPSLKMPSIMGTWVIQTAGLTVQRPAAAGNSCSQT
ncbi:MAG: hypothetical protein DMG96_00390 [Acidobacteria bacterium]|nr:MAG: hypothetical protein DMG96_00390 [Acidobacteriota bacterium]